MPPVTSDGRKVEGMGLTPAQRQRALGAVVAAATGDALGAPYEFQAPVAASDDVDMVGGGILDWQPGEWTDDTSMAIVVLEAAATSPGLHDLRVDSAQDQIAREWYSWSLGTPDIGTLTSSVMRRAADNAREDGHFAPRAADLRRAAEAAHEATPRNAGNGSLMRTHAAVLPYLLTSEDDAVSGIEAVCTLTHVHPDTVEACMLWGLAVRHAVLTGEIDVRRGLERLDEGRRALWSSRIDEAERSAPEDFRRNGWVVHAFQAALAAVHGAGPIPEDRFARRDMLRRVLDAAARAGYDTDTVACIAGALAGAALGVKSVPPEWRRMLFGWPGYELDELVSLTDRVIGPVGSAGEGRERSA